MCVCVLCSRLAPSLPPPLVSLPDCMDSGPPLDSQLTGRHTIICTMNMTFVTGTTLLYQYQYVYTVLPRPLPHPLPHPLPRAGMTAGSGRKTHSEAGSKPALVGGPPVQGLYDQSKSPVRTSTPLYISMCYIVYCTLHQYVYIYIVYCISMSEASYLVGSRPRCPDI